MRKNTQILIAYSALFAAAVAGVCYDAHVRSHTVPALSEAEKLAAERRAKGNVASRTVELPSAATSVHSEVGYAAKAGSPAHSSNAATELPRGIFLIKETVTVESTSGVKCELEAGTTVSLMRREEGKMKVTCDGRDFLLEENLLTRNSKAVSRLIARKG
ncbi:MAG: hypothetical protein RL088_81 [Verrucomicrobiota bacterium]|jgi:hypothetical protein